MIGGWDTFCEIALRRMSLDLTDDKSTLVQVMAWCRQAPSHYLSQCWPRSLSPYDITRPQWVNWRRWVSHPHSHGWSSSPQWFIGPSECGLHTCVPHSPGIPQHGAMDGGHAVCTDGERLSKPEDADSLGLMNGKNCIMCHIWDL